MPKTHATKRRHCRSTSRSPRSIGIKLPVPKVTDDATFLRRVFLVSIGRIPTSEEALAFLEIEDPAKRENLVDYLLKSPGFPAT